MGATKENPCYRILSCRVTDEEYDRVQTIVHEGGEVSVSEVVRTAINSFLTERKSD